MGLRADRDAVGTASSEPGTRGTVFNMADPRHIAPAIDASIESVSTLGTRVLLTQADFDALVRELDALRTKHRDEVARRLREARTFGASTENDDFQAVAEDAAFDQARIAKLEYLVSFASVVDGPDADDGAGLGSTVRVSDDAGHEREYLLVGRRDEHSGPHDVTMASPVGTALWGSRSGDIVTAALPNGRSRTLRVRAVVHGSIATPDGGAARAA
jgi:transcription elongation factor GreA